MTSDTRNRNIIIVAVVLLIAACCCIAAAIGIGAAVSAGRQAVRTIDNFDLGTVPASTTFSRSFAVDSPASLEVDLDIGSLEISAGDQPEIQVDATIKAYGVDAADAQRLLDDLQLTATQSGSNVQVIGRWPDFSQLRGRSPEIEMRITVPPATSIDVDLAAGRVAVSGVEGDVVVKADVGQVELRDLRIPEKLDVESNLAEISFYGPLTEGSAYRFTSDVGAIRLHLPADSRFAIDAASDVGAVVVDFDVVGESTRELTGASVKGVVGGEEDTTLYLRSDIGAIYVEPQ